MSAFKLHHVQYGRSFRVLWLIEEADLEEKIGPLEVVEYQIGSAEMREGGCPASRPPCAFRRLKSVTWR